MMIWIEDINAKCGRLYEELSQPWGFGKVITNETARVYFYEFHLRGLYLPRSIPTSSTHALGAERISRPSQQRRKKIIATAIKHERARSQNHFAIPKIPLYHGNLGTAWPRLSKDTSMLQPFE